MEQYLIYLRKSRSDLEAEAHGEGETLSRHEHTLLELAKRQHLNVTDIYREVVSGDTIAVLVMEVERLARGDTIDQGIIAQTFKFSGTKIITPIKTYDPDNEFDEEYFEFGLFMSRREYKIINRRLQRGRLASAKEGKWPSGLAPFGYRRVKLKNEKGCSLEPIEEQAAIVRMIFDLYTVGLQDEDGSARPLSLGSIATRLNDMHIPSPSGSQWARITIRGIIKNPTYIGMVRWGSRETKKKVVDGKVVSVRGPADPENFYPRPPRGGRLYHIFWEKSRFFISIHALREEGDRLHGNAAHADLNFYPRPPRGGRLAAAVSRKLLTEHFYPRPPRGGRPTSISVAFAFFLFLSTPSARRATKVMPVFNGNETISIHALREEGDSR